MTENNFNLSEFHHSIYLHSHLSEVYYYIASADGICKWFIGNAEYTGNDGNTLNAADIASKGRCFYICAPRRENEFSTSVYLSAECLTRSRFYAMLRIC